MHSRLTCVPHTRVCPRHPQALLFTPVAAFLTTRKTSLLYTYRLSHSKTDQAGTERNPDADKPLVGTGLRRPLLLVADRLRSEFRADLPTDPQAQGCRATVGPGGLAGTSSSAAPSWPVSRAITVRTRYDLGLSRIHDRYACTTGAQRDVGCTIRARRH